VPEYLFISRRHRQQSSKIRPVRFTQPRFRLIDRHGDLPPLEWWDPAKARSISFPEYRELREYCLSIYRAPLGARRKLRCYSMLLPWIKTRRKRLWRDLIIAADQALYNIQSAKTTTARFPSGGEAS
jgi:hypothetical protein